MKSSNPQIVDCKHAYSVEVLEQYGLETPFNTTHSTKAPAMGDTALILTNPEHCDECPKLVEGETYLIGGSYRKGSDGSVTWLLEETGDQALVSNWVTRYGRKINGWISSSNADRRRAALFSQMCEKDGHLVASEQWSVA